MAVKNALLTVAEFASLPQPAAGVRQELHHGELVVLPPVKKLHTKLQKRLVSAIEAILNPTEHGVDKEFPFRPTPEHEVWVADVAVFNLELWDQTPDDDYFCGVPPIVIEVLSPSNSASEILDREDICLRNGGQEFWVVDPKSEIVKVISANGHSMIYDTPSIIQSTVLRKAIAVRDIFAS